MDRLVIKLIETEEEFIKTLPLLNGLREDERQYGIDVCPLKEIEALDNYRRALTCGYRHIYGKLNGEAVVIAGLRALPDPYDNSIFYEVNNLFVHEMHRRKGIGTAVMNWIHDYCQSIGAAGLRLMMYKGNEKARAYYEKLDYKCPCDMFLKKFDNENFAAG